MGQLSIALASLQGVAHHRLAPGAGELGARPVRRHPPADRERRRLGPGLGRRPRSGPSQPPGGTGDELSPAPLPGCAQARAGGERRGLQAQPRHCREPVRGRRGGALRRHHRADPASDDAGLADRRRSPAGDLRARGGDPHRASALRGQPRLRAAAGASARGARRHPLRPLGAASRRGRGRAAGTSSLWARSGADPGSHRAWPTRWPHGRARCGY